MSGFWQASLAGFWPGSAKSDCISAILARSMAGSGQIQPDSDYFCQIQGHLVHWNPVTAAELRRILAIEYQNLGLSAVDFSYLQTPMPVGNRFSQTCVQGQRV